MSLANRGVGKSIILLSVLMAGCTDSTHSPEGLATANKNAAWHHQYLSSRITALQPERGGVMLTGTLFATDAPQTKVLPVGYTITFPDDHGWRKYTLASISDGGAVIDYWTLFDHRSFGRNLIETDAGSFLLEWIPQDAAADAALKAAQAFLAHSHVDASGHDLSTPARIDKYTENGRKGWRIQWASKASSTGKGGEFLGVLGGRFNVIVWDSGEVEVQYGR